MIINRSALISVLLAIGLWLAPPCLAMDSAPDAGSLTEALELLDQANELAATSELQARQLYRQAAASIDEIRTAGNLHNAALEHALGNAYLGSGERGHAVLAYRRATLLDPTNAQIAETLRSTRADVGSQIAASRTNRIIAWLLTWRGTVPRSAAWGAATGAFLIGWLLVALRIGTGIRPLLSLGVVCLAGSLIAFAAVGLDHWESRSRTIGVLLEPSVIARTGPSSRIFDPAFQEPLTGGVEFIVVDNRDGWSKVQLASNALGWVPTDAIGLVIEREGS